MVSRMAKTRIEWADAVWNPVTGCTPISEGCQNCYAKRMSKRLAGRCGYPADDPFRVTLHPERLGEPLRWKEPRRVFVCSMGDLFHEDVPFEFIASVFGVMANSSQNTYMVLTKRPQRMKEFFDWLSLSAASYYARDHRTVPYDDDRINVFIMKIASEYGINLDFMRKWPLFNVWLGVTAENQQRADERIPILLQIPAAVRFISVEPMLGLVDLTGIRFDRNTIMNVLEGCGINRLSPCQSIPNAFCEKIDWVICGGETGPRARPLHPNWVRNLRDQCQAAGVPFFFKKHGEWLHETQGINFHEGHIYYVWPDESMSFRVGKKAAVRLLDGRTWDEMPRMNY